MIMASVMKGLSISLLNVNKSAVTNRQLRICSCLLMSHCLVLLFHDVSPYHIETSQIICRANQRTGFNMIGTFVTKELKQNFIFGAIN